MINSCVRSISKCFNFNDSFQKETDSKDYAYARNNASVPVNHYLISLSDDFKYVSRLCDECIIDIKKYYGSFFHKFYLQISEEEFSELQSTKSIINNNLKNEDIFVLPEVKAFCNKWGVKIEIQDEDEFKNTFNIKRSTLTRIDLSPRLNDNRFFQNPFYTMGIDLDELKIFSTKKVIHDSGAMNLDKRCTAILHELTHLIFRIYPNEIYELGSPFYLFQAAAQYKLKCGISFFNYSKRGSMFSFLSKNPGKLYTSRLFVPGRRYPAEDSEPTDDYKSFIDNAKISDIIHSANVVLKDNGLVDRNGEFTYDNTDLKLTKDWLYDKELDLDYLNKM